MYDIVNTIRERSARIDPHASKKTLNDIVAKNKGKNALFITTVYSSESIVAANSFFKNALRALRFAAV